jgi:lipopolysaccharide export LptBFGC system permease protein LptF
MTGRADEIAAPGRELSPQRHHVLLSPFGWYTRYMLRALLQHTAVATVGVIIVALTVDLAPQLKDLLASGPDDEGIGVVTRLGWYLLLRSADFAPRLLPIGCFLGVLACETAHTWSGERLAIWNAGRSPLQCLVPAAILSVGAGFIQFGLDAYLRPAAVATQIAERIGEYGVRYDRRLSKNRTWITAGNSLVHGHIEFGPPPAFRNVMIYRLHPDGRLHEVIAALVLKPGPGEDVWLAQGVSRWNFAPGGEQSGAEEAAKSQTEQEIVLQIDPLWLSNFGISPMFLPQAVLTKLANSGGALSRQKYQTWAQVRHANILLPGGMVIFAMSLSLLLLAHGASFNALLFMAFAGYAGHVSMRAFVLLGEYGYAAPAVAAWATPVAQLVAAAIVLTIVQLRGAGLGKAWRRADRRSPGGE